MKQRILVPCDYSDWALNALFFASELALKLGGEVIVLSVMDEDRDTGESLQAARYQKMFHEVTRTGLFTGVAMKPLIKPGRLIREVVRVSIELNITYLVVGTEGARGWDGVFTGSYSGKFIRVSPVPVFSIKYRIHLTQIRRIVFAGDFEQHFNTFIDALKKIQEIFRARLFLLHIDTGGRESETETHLRIRDYAQKNQLVQYSIYIWKHEDETKGIIDFAIEIGADLIAMSTHARDLSHLHITSIAADVVNHSRIPVWTYAGEAAT